MATTKETLSQEFSDPEARRDYADIFLNSSIALQIKILRQQKGREWTQGELARRAGLHQSQISAMERSTHSAWSLRTLKKLADAFDLALVVRFASYGELLDNVAAMSRPALERPSFADDPAFRASVERRSSQTTPTLQPETLEESTAIRRNELQPVSTSTRRYTKGELPAAGIPAGASLSAPRATPNNLPSFSYIERSPNA